MTLQFRKLHPLFVAEASPVDLRDVHDDETLEQIRAGMDEHAVLVFRDQALSSEEQRDFATRLDGELHRKTGISILQKSRFGDEALTDVSNVGPDGEILEAEDRKRQYGIANRLWHTDASFQDPRGRYSMLAALVLPPVASDTEFADMRAAYDALTDEAKATLEGLRVHHSIAYSRITLGFDFSEEESDRLKGAIQPLILENPRTGRRSLYLASHASRILDRPVPDGRLLLRDLIEHATQPQFVHRHSWRSGDFVIWDNRATMHRARPFDDTLHRREMRRVTSLDTGDPARIAQPVWALRTRRTGRRGANLIGATRAVTASRHAGYSARPFSPRREPVVDLPLESRLSIGYQNVLAPTGYDDEEGAAAGRDLPETVRLLDARGFDSIWSGDHVAFAGPILDPLLQLAQAAALSDRLTVGTAVYLLPLRHPSPVAKQVATLDTISNGRVIFGVGVGGEFPLEFELCGVPVEERGARLSEGIRVLRKLWSGRPVAHDGRFYTFPEVAIQPPPAQPGGPPIWCGGRADPALRRAGRLADGWMSYVVDPERYRRSLDTIAAAAADAGRTLERFGTSHLLFVRLDEDRETALEFAAKFLSVRYAMDFSRAAERYCALGDAAEVAELIRAFHTAGMRHLVLNVLAPESGKAAQLERFADEVMPLLADLR